MDAGGRRVAKGADADRFASPWRVMTAPRAPLPAGADDHELATWLATEAGLVLLELRGQHGSEPADPAALKAEGDASSQRFLAAALAMARPDDAVLSEEAADVSARLAADRVWIIDPLDGTREFGEPPRDDWAVHVALVIGGHLAVGAVALPSASTTFSTSPVPSPPPRHEGPIRMLVSRTRAHPATVAASEALGAVLVPMGSAGAKAMAVVRGAADVYAHAGGQYEWDSAAPAAVAAAAGLHVSGIDGRPLGWNKPDPWSPDLLICRPELADRVVDAMRVALADQPGS